ncbi:MAG: alanine--tRNA ligase-related protein [Candidatus Gracilibacteria bacterium]|jgi:alanyl-tRNA synthetase
MEPTELLYMSDMAATEGTATVQSVLDSEGKTIVFLDRTLFYAQGGGQPYDKGSITSAAASFEVDEVRYLDGLIKHIGHFTSGRFAEGDAVSLHIEPSRRALHRRLHSGGHVVDLALKRLNIDWIPGKGYHFPDGPYIEYEGSLEGMNKEELLTEIEKTCNEIIQENIPTRIEFVSAEELQNRGFQVPPSLSPGKPLRIVYYGDFGVPCGGTHVDQMGDLGHMTIRKIKQEGANIRVAYAVE